MLDTVCSILYAVEIQLILYTTLYYINCNGPKLLVHSRSMDSTVGH